MFRDNVTVQNCRAGQEGMRRLKEVLVPGPDGTESCLPTGRANRIRQLDSLGWGAASCSGLRARGSDTGDLGPRGRLQTPPEPAGWVAPSSVEPVYKRREQGRSGRLRGLGAAPGTQRMVGSRFEGRDRARMRPGWAQALLVSSAVLAGAHGSAGCFWDHGRPSPALRIPCLDWLNAQSRPPGPPPGPASRAPPAPSPAASSPAALSPAAPAQRPPAPRSEDGQVFAPADALPARSEAAAVRPVTGGGRRPKSTEKKDLGALGYALGGTMVAVIVAAGAGVVLGYTYKRGRDLQQQTRQKVLERELQRITLPLSAFSNPTCEVVDEKTVVVHSNQTPVDPREGSAPLMARAGTPGA